MDAEDADAADRDDDDAAAAEDEDMEATTASAYVVSTQTCQCRHKLLGDTNARIAVNVGFVVTVPFRPASLVTTQ